MSAYLPAKQAATMDARRISRRFGSAAAGLLVFGFFGWMLLMGAPSWLGGRHAGLTLLRSNTDRPDVILKSARAEKKYEFVTVVGTVSNVSQRELRNVEVV